MPEIKCKVCGETNADDVTYCSLCGADLINGLPYKDPDPHEGQVMCGICGNFTFTDTGICDWCGNDIEAGELITLSLSQEPCPACGGKKYAGEEVCSVCTHFLETA